MRFTLWALFCLLVIYSCTPSHKQVESSVNLIPQPQMLELGHGSYSLDKEYLVYTNSEKTQKEIHFLSEFLNNNYGISLSRIADVEQNAHIKIYLTDEIAEKEGYSLNIEKNIIIKAQTPTGVFYAIQTLLQLLPSEYGKYSSLNIPVLQIEDYPNYAWRGLNLDVCRHFSSVETVKKIIDGLAMHKMNVFHWHLTEDQGWRIEIKKYPKLTEIGSQRKETVIGHLSEYPTQFDNTPHGGFYTQEQIKEVVAYAAKRHITVVPEIELPGHALAALAAYPQFSCTGGPFEVFTEWGVTDDVYCAGKEGTFEFLEDVLTEVLELFPSQYIHIGGDECPKGNWKKCQDCQKRIQEEGLKDELELQSYVIKRIEKFLAQHDRTLIGWDEIIEGGLPERANVMVWRGIHAGEHAASLGHDVIMSPYKFVYLDYYQGQYYEPIAISGHLPLERVYNYDPVPEGLDDNFHKHVLGIHASIWTEYIKTSEHLQYMLFPRLTAISETGWTNRDLKDFESFTQRMPYHYPRLDNLGLNYRVDYPQGLLPQKKFADGKALLQLESTIPGSKIYYTIDGSTPDQSSILYEGGINIKFDSSLTLKAINILPSGKSSNVFTSTLLNTGYHQASPEPSDSAQIKCSYYEGKFSSALDLIHAEPIKKSIVENIDLGMAQRESFYGLKFEGWFHAPKKGLYTFKLHSDDGSVLYLNDEEVVNNDGFHYGIEKAGEVLLEAGFHTYTLYYFNAKYGGQLRMMSFQPGEEIKEVAFKNPFIEGD